MTQPVTAYLALGANLGDARATVRRAIDDLGRLPQTRLLAASSLYRTAPHEAQGPDFINAVVAVETGLDAHALLAHLQGLENAAGRERPWPNAPRTLDLDLILFGGERIASTTLQVPHPRWTQRAFVLVPLSEIAPQHVTAQMREAVASQAIERLAS